MSAIDEKQLVWLLGHDRPARAIPAGLMPAPVMEVADDDHVPLHSLGRDPANSHRRAVPGHDNYILGYPHDPDHHHQILISAPNQKLLNRHLATTSVWIRAGKPGENAADGKGEPLYLLKFIEEAAASVTGSSLEELAKSVGDERPSNLNDLLGDKAGDVRGAATEALAGGLEGLVNTGVIDIEDRKALDAAALIDALLTEPRDSDAPAADAIVTTILHPPDAGRVNFSIKING